MNSRQNWQQRSAKVFWAEIAPTEHIVQIYESDEKFLELLRGFVAGGIANGEYTIVIATSAHLKALHETLTTHGIDVDRAIQDRYYVPLDAEEALSTFMVNGWPDENLFNHLVSELIANARKQKRTVRAFGEMVAILWAKGHVGATVRLEQLWNKFCETEAFCLFCAYPQSGFTQDATDSLSHICSTHSKIITNGNTGMNDIFFQEVGSAGFLER